MYKIMWLIFQIDDAEVFKKELSIFEQKQCIKYIMMLRNS